jgi:hypothetical protein
MLGIVPADANRGGSSGLLVFASEGSKNSALRSSWPVLNTPFFPSIWNFKSAGPILTTKRNSAFQYSFFNFQNCRCLSFVSFPVSLYVTETISLQPASVDKAGSFPTGSDDITIVAVLEVLWSLSARVAWYNRDTPSLTLISSPSLMNQLCKLAWGFNGGFSAYSMMLLTNRPSLFSSLVTGRPKCLDSSYGTRTATP